MSFTSGSIFWRQKQPCLSTYCERALGHHGAILWLWHQVMSKDEIVPFLQNNLGLADLSYLKVQEEQHLIGRSPMLASLTGILFLKLVCLVCEHTFERRACNDLFF
jgi:hypothetical protein